MAPVLMPWITTDAAAPFDLDDRFAERDGIGEPLVKIRAVVD
jgi:hypothetical protein